jgi:hypothetical protein
MALGLRYKNVKTPAAKSLYNGRFFVKFLSHLQHSTPGTSGMDDERTVTVLSFLQRV